ncbi:hypothetical protein G3N58_16175 [Paraburkholderia sp. Ac-20342]|uniref:hypothetical protein n=1 Tax=Paraburkholderia sp. Ac-20342 TaxID=2703889 RepID=UPI001980D8B7|nr:hypothetical protein [Paraburkholderia sp. Ac-20342]MBN3848355.1 hypothetical protein [Paraburkholderia sp. Ac-20342]
MRNRSTLVRFAAVAYGRQQIASESRLSQREENTVKKQSNEALSQSREFWGAIASAARQQAAVKSWERPLRAAARGKRSTGTVKLHPGWDAAFKRARAS